VDLAVVTNGEGGYRYATLAEPLYGLRLTDEHIGRAHLPRIRKRELMAAGAILGIRSFFFLDQVDQAYTEDAGTVLTQQWDAASVGRSLREILERGHYGFVFVPLPTATTHGAHQAAAVLALDAIASLPEGRRPAVLGGTDFRRGDSRPAFTGLGGYPVTAVPPDRPVLEFDRTGKLGHQARLDYRIVVNWVIAEHKSQGLTQTLMNADDVELYYLFALNGPRAVAAVQALFGRLAGARQALGRRTEPYLGRYSGVCLMDR
jgi:LmbE family N-acetylglucosaminyl deacetylase